MENIYDIRKKENLLFVMPISSSLNEIERSKLHKTAIAVNLYYPDTVERFVAYLNRLDTNISIYVFSSNPEVLKKVEELKSRPMTILPKENRGRDISALLVAFREIAQNYEYICFVHDKAAKNQHTTEDVKRWIKNMWDNTLASKEYVDNVLGLLASRADLGLLVPPEPAGEYIDAWYGDAWKESYNASVDLAERLGLKCNMRRDKQPITLSTAFWAKTKALDKLLKQEWCYEDFPQEPMANDGTISHAIERILGYVAQDAGYKTGTIMTDEYAAWNLLFAQDSMRLVMELLAKKKLAHCTHEIISFNEIEQPMREYFSKNKKVYLYGAGIVGNRFLSWCKEWELSIAGFVVSDNQIAEPTVAGIPVYKLGELPLSGEEGFIITVAKIHWQDMECELKKRGISNYIFLY